MHQTETEPQPLPPLQEEPSPEALAAVAEQVLAKPDSNGDGQVTRVDPRHMKQLEELWGGPLCSGRGRCFCGDCWSDRGMTHCSVLAIATGERGHRMR
jgi:hypothetical protein